LCSPPRISDTIEVTQALVTSEGDMLREPPDDIPEDDDGTDTLGQVSLDFFRATPSEVGPFESSTLTWRASGPPTGWRLVLDQRSVARSGAIAVRPLSTKTYGLSARAGRWGRALGSIRVVVDLDACETGQYFDFRSQLDGLLRRFIDDDPKLRFRLIGATVLYPTFKFEPGRISFSLRLKKSQDTFPDPSVDVDVSFGFDVANEDIVVSHLDIDIDVSFPFWAWGVPGAIPGLAIATGLAKDDAKKMIRDKLNEITGLVRFYTVPSHRRPHSIAIIPTSGNEVIIEVLHCPDADLARFLEEHGLEQSPAGDERQPPSQKAESGAEHQKGVRNAPG
jgi:hypothetical protein